MNSTQNGDRWTGIVCEKWRLRGQIAPSAVSLTTFRQRLSRCLFGFRTHRQLPNRHSVPAFTRRFQNAVVPRCFMNVQDEQRTANFRKTDKKRAAILVLSRKSVNLGIFWLTNGELCGILVKENRKMLIILSKAVHRTALFLTSFFQIKGPSAALSPSFSACPRTASAVRLWALYVLGRSSFFFPWHFCRFPRRRPVGYCQHHSTPRIFPPLVIAITKPLPERRENPLRPVF